MPLIGRRGNDCPATRERALSSAWEKGRGRHIARGLKCESCHADAAHPAPVKKEKCLSCHGGSYEKLAEQTDSLEINPHDSHLGKIECTKCHRGHKPAVLECARCHDFSRELHIR